MKISGRTSDQFLWWHIAAGGSLLATGLLVCVTWFPTAPGTWFAVVLCLLFVIFLLADPRLRYWRRAGWCFGMAAAIAVIPAVTLRVSSEALGDFSFASDSAPLAVFGFLAAGIFLSWLDHLREERSQRVVVENDRKAQEGNSPGLPAFVIGRDGDLQSLLSRLVRAADNVRRVPVQVLVVLRGWPGIGKTTLARVVAHSPEIARDFPDGVLWASLGPSPALLRQLLAWGRSLHSADVADSETVQEASERLAGLLRERRMLLIVDDVWDVGHAKAFTVGGRCCATLVTTRLRHVAESLSPSPEDSVHLDVLSEEDGLSLLEALAPQVVATYRHECLELVRILEGLPLALQVAGRLLRVEQQNGWSVPQLLMSLHQDLSHVLDAAAPSDITTSADGVGLTVESLLRTSTDRLDVPTRSRFASLGPFAPRPATFELEDLRAVWQTDELATRQTVDTLIDRGLLESVGSGEYQIHQILVEHAKRILSRS